MRLERAAWWSLLKTGVFTVVVPGTVALLIPRWLLGPAQSAPTPFPILREILGIFLIGIGTLLYLRCAWDFAVRGLGTPLPLDAPRRLVIQGLYRYVRNPMYLGVGSVILGEAVLYGSMRVGIYFAAAWIFWQLFVVFYEEPTLRRMFGEEYEDYRRRVPRWIPRLPS
jgi:protein-S-isoprenylcysteine O-methyltransferase Ste14